KIARRIAAEDGITSGPVCVLTCVEPCRSFQIYRNRDTQQLELQPRDRKCLFLYHYSVHPVFGFLNARIQTWFPLSIQICLNGREWLAHQMDAVGLDYLRDDNCFPWIEDWPTAQQLMDQQLKVEWPTLLDDIARTLNPIHAEIFEARPTHYYWSTYQSEWAIDISFRTPEQLRRLYPRPLRRGIADLHRRAEVSRKATERYLDALASVDEDTTLDDVLHRLGQPTYWHGRRVRALQPFAPDDRQLIQAISRGEFTINGVR